MTHNQVIMNWLLGRAAHTAGIKSYKDGELYYKHNIIGKRQPEGYCLIYLTKFNEVPFFNNYVQLLLNCRCPCIGLSVTLSKKLKAEQILALIDVFNLQKLKGYVPSNFNCIKYRWLAKYRDAKTSLTIKTIFLSLEKSQACVLPNINQKHLVHYNYIREREEAETIKAILPVYKKTSTFLMPLEALAPGINSASFSLDNVIKFAMIFKNDSENRILEAFKKAQKTLERHITITT